ncbi:MAG: alpha/beta hydrolase [Chloroflexi bacterium]|nr:alpha/beta hydrolase [Chloroflexota bacterium]MCC6896751.1 alpha/beta hydrolase [Anaerolineae bacterium]
MPYAETERGMIWYADHRDPTLHRPVTVVIHGAGGTHLDWPAEIRRLPELNAVILDLPGHGRSAGTGRNSVGAYASDVLAFMDALKLDKAILAGHSMGGAIAQTIALQHPARVIGLILIGTSAKLGVHPDLLNGMVNEFKRTVNVLVSLYYGTRPNESMVRRSQQRLSDFNPVTLYNDYVACNAFDLRDQLQHITVPTLIIGGSDDRMTPYKASSFLNAHIAGSRLVQIDGGGHMMMLEQPETAAEAIREWLMAQTF